MINKEAIKKLQSALRQIDEAQPLCPSPGCDILSNAGMNVDLALEILKEQPPASDFTIEMRLTYELRPKVIEGKIAAKHIFDLCDRLDASGASRKELLTACKVGFSYIQAIAHRIPRPLGDLSDDRELVKVAIEKQS